MTTKTIVGLREKIGKVIRCIELGKTEAALEYCNKIDAILKEVKLPNEDDFSVGYFCAIANMMRDHDNDVIAKDCLGANFMNIKKMKRIGVDESDIEILKPIVKDIERRMEF